MVVLILFVFLYLFKVCVCLCVHVTGGLPVHCGKFGQTYSASSAGFFQLYLGGVTNPPDIEEQ